MKTILVTFNDTHANNRRGLMNPDTVLAQIDERGQRVKWKPQPTDTQVYLWRLYGYCLEAVKRIARGAPIIVVHNGDECQGNKHAADHVSAVISDEIAIAVSNFEPLFKLPNLKALRFAHSTEAHNFSMGTSTNLVKAQLAALHPEIDIDVCYHGLLDIDGFVNDYAHHGPNPGSRDWLHGNVARFYLRDLMLHEIARGQRPPDVVWRAHYHTPVYELLETEGRRSELFVVPSFCAPGPYEHQATRSTDTVTFGMVVLELENGRKVGEHRLYDTLDIRTREKL